MIDLKCFHPHTKILTTSGWKCFPNITNHDLIFTYNFKTKLFEAEKPIEIIDEYWKGTMYFSRYKRLRFAITENHKMLHDGFHVTSIKNLYLRYKTFKIFYDFEGFSNYRKIEDQVVKELAMYYNKMLKFENNKFFLKKDSPYTIIIKELFPNKLEEFNEKYYIFIVEKMTYEWVIRNLEFIPYEIIFNNKRTIKIFLKFFNSNVIGQKRENSRRIQIMRTILKKKQVLILPRKLRPKTYEGRIYCVNTHNKFILTKYRKSILLSGNCNSEETNG